eukprot:TRINITY_DN522_c0_g1_i1.p1 TRINITY_DN522_c0_g1~~TRINITY_DN522_c0_g1_i1.p1  ORF type:complete len:197 (+),score=59.51 TRINITY_DN522_c0_g1_i1:36-626(+)
MNYLKTTSLFTASAQLRNKSGFKSHAVRRMTRKNYTTEPVTNEEKIEYLQNNTEVLKPTPNVVEALEAIEQLKFLEYIGFIKVLNEKISEHTHLFPAFGSPGAQNAAEAPAEAAPEPVEEKKEEPTICDVKLISVPQDKRLVLMKNFRKLRPGLGMMETKELCTNLPSILMKEVPADKKKEWEDMLTEAGCEFEFV